MGISMIFFTFILSVIQKEVLSTKVENELKLINKTLDISLLMQNMSESLPQLMSMIKNHVNTEDEQFFEVINDSTEDKSEFSLRCSYNEGSGRCPIKPSSDNSCPSDYVPALVDGTTIVVINNELLANAGLTPEKLRNMINSGAITCVPIEMTSHKPTPRTTTTTESPIISNPSSSSSGDMNKMILLILLNLLNQSNNKRGDTIPNPCPACSCKNCASGSSQNSGTDNAFSQLANAIIGMEQLKFDLIKKKINADAQILGSKFNIDMHLVKSKMGLQQALVNALLGSLNSIGSGQSSSDDKASHKDSREQRNFNNRTDEN